MHHDDQEKIARLVDSLMRSCGDNLAVNHVEGHDLPDKKSVENVLDMLLAVLFPGYTQGTAVSPASLPYYFGDRLLRIESELTNQSERALAYDCRVRKTQDIHCRACDRATMAVAKLMDALPRLREILKDDIQAAFEHDPAAESLDVIVFCYPGIEAIATHRLANILYREQIPIIPRMWTERAHSHTGIDIHPGATIGRRFFIDHGTGVVVGESTVIGDNVSLYQGVTLGALSPIKGQALRSVKRHPTIEDDVIIYSGATILGGETVIGKGSIVAGGVFLTESVPARSQVTLGEAELIIKHRPGKSERLIAAAPARKP